MWDFETIDTADVTDESGIFEMEPMNELKVGSDVALKSIVKSPDEEEPTMWYAQVRRLISFNTQIYGPTLLDRDFSFRVPL